MLRFKHLKLGKASGITPWFRQPFYEKNSSKLKKIPDFKMKINENTLETHYFEPLNNQKEFKLSENKQVENCTLNVACITLVTRNWI